MLSILLPLLVLSKGVLAGQDVPVIAAASNIKFALDELAKQFTQDTGSKVRLSYGSSGNFVAQIQHGAPFQIFMSADEKYIEQLAKSGVTVDDGVLYAVGRLAIVAPNNSSLKLDPELTGLKALIDSGELKRFAIANPDHAPYGERARGLLKQFGLWESITPKLIYGENVAQAAQFAVSGSTQGGIIALSLAIAPQFQKMGHYQALPESLHAPIYQRMVLTNKAGPTARAFYQFLQTDSARQVFSEFGFGLPTKVITGD
ncbi:molybdate ABC transporter substrate-binding protein [Shewanella sp. D64]|uniref:molybdate ABC transporter substrate-binding protein n=1 Tax=unclassified Shewanella TaxID=196818 RepID=UPI0022BA1E52|nr:MULTISPECIES: molybdate ABC transporter substrate-binding protein [unclassified Shewanella]MEC4726243.1 molybdate ABC transporter substrate-binding protein [Shewanella sp. D64]MEC4738255.1 molybdate ABC transporter substrate-binding protein [Shewanella sp. E94]WBJ98312.1 molybdate ABC transporter substrate-binding protein [Shewanella sp. MTB7]